FLGPRAIATFLPRNASRRRASSPGAESLSVASRRSIRAWAGAAEFPPSSCLTSNVRSVSSGHDQGGRPVTKPDAGRKIRILDYIAATLRARGFPPSVREIAKAVGLASTSAVQHPLLILEREGYLERGAAQSRPIRL